MARAWPLPQHFQPRRGDQRIDPLGPVPPYRQIAAIIKRGILSGQYPADTRIPTESELVETYEVARSTARRAVAALREDGESLWRAREQRPAPGFPDSRHIPD